MLLQQQQEQEQEQEQEQQQQQQQQEQEQEQVTSNKDFNVVAVHNAATRSNVCLCEYPSWLFSTSTHITDTTPFHWQVLDDLFNLF